MKTSVRSYQELTRDALRATSAGEEVVAELFKRFRYQIDDRPTVRATGCDILEPLVRFLAEWPAVAASIEVRGKTAIATVTRSLT